MKPYLFRNFKKDGFTIPNSDSDLVIEEVMVDDPYSWSTGTKKVKGKSITYKGKFIFSFVDSWNYYRLIKVDQDAAIKLKLITRETSELFSNVIDALYYIYNPAKYTKHGGLIKVETIKAIYRRLDGDSLARSKTTQDMLKILKDALDARATQLGHVKGTSEYNLAITNELKAIGLWKVYKICYFTGDYGIRNALRESTLNNEKIAWNQDEVNLSDYNLVYESGFLLYPDQYQWNGKTWSETDGKVRCPCCKNQVPKIAYNKETKECLICENRHYEIHSYSTRVPQLLKFKAHKVKPETLYLGCELEFETTDKNEARLKVGKALKGHAIMKSDGSIRNGFEVVTCPATIDIHMEEFKKFYSDLPGELRNASNVGMHVHVSRKPLSILTVGKLTAFMNRGDNKPFIEYVAGRRNNTYCHQSSRSVTYPWTNQHGGERYNTLNLCNKDTIEFRIFSTPMTFNEFASKMQFCQALVDYCKPANLSLSLKEMTYFQNFINWVMPLRKEYPQLVETLKGFA